uniref:Uncharacterized protein n=2 Tax=Spironucleus salmonicida TaxID=348837 RepID=V6LFF1_9EUKA|eukprot:EST43217.1 Hypothetical protein SS50377_17081 [Spironucleus salmonicida]
MPVMACAILLLRPNKALLTTYAMRSSHKAAFRCQRPHWQQLELGNAQSGHARDGSQRLDSEKYFWALQKNEYASGTGLQLEYPQLQYSPAASPDYHPAPTMVFQRQIAKSQIAGLALSCWTVPGQGSFAAVPPRCRYTVLRWAGLQQPAEGLHAASSSSHGGGEEARGVRPRPITKDSQVSCCQPGQCKCKCPPSHASPKLSSSSSSSESDARAKSLAADVFSRALPKSAGGIVEWAETSARVDEGEGTEKLQDEVRIAWHGMLPGQLNARHGVAATKVLDADQAIVVFNSVKWKWYITLAGRSTPI